VSEIKRGTDAAAMRGNYTTVNIYDCVTANITSSWSLPFKAAKHGSSFGFADLKHGSHEDDLRESAVLIRFFLHRPFIDYANFVHIYGPKLMDYSIVEGHIPAQLLPAGSPPQALRLSGTNGPSPYTIPFRPQETHVRFFIKLHE